MWSAVPKPRWSTDPFFWPSTMEDGSVLRGKGRWTWVEESGRPRPLGEAYHFDNRVLANNRIAGKQARESQRKARTKTA